jgi:hypothetical protein
MLRRTLASILLALALAGGHHVTVAADAPVYLVCVVPNELDIWIQIDNFKGVGGAKKQCYEMWHGEPAGFIR